MKSIVGIYESHIQAIEAVRVLKDAGYPVQRISLIGKAYHNEDHTFLKSNKKLQSTTE